MPDDYGASTSTTGTIVVGGSASGTVETALDSDWFRIDLAAGTTYQFDLTGVTLADAYLRLRDSSGFFLQSDLDSGPGLDSRIYYTPTQSGTYYLDAAGWLSTHTGTYTLNATTIVDEDQAADTSTTGTIAPGGSATGLITGSTDDDWFRTTLTAGTIYRIDLIGDSLADPYLTLYNASGLFVASDDDSGTGLNSQLTYTPSITGTYFIGAGGVGTGSGTYNLALTTQGTAAPDDYAATTSTTGSIAVGGSITGEIESSNDRDWFRVSLSAGSTYVIDLRGVDSGGGTLDDPVVKLYNASGTYLTERDDGGEGIDSRLLYTAPTSGTYYINAEEFTAATGTYTLSIRETLAPYADVYRYFGTGQASAGLTSADIGTIVAPPQVNLTSLPWSDAAHAPVSSNADSFTTVAKLAAIFPGAGIEDWAAPFELGSITDLSNAAWRSLYVGPG